LFIYNIWLIPGISYLSRAQEEEALQKLNLLRQDRTSSSSATSEGDGDMPLKRMADILFTERMKMNFKEWHDVIVSQPDSHLSGNIKCTAGQFQTVFFKMRPAVILNGFSSHQLQLIQQVLLTLELSNSWADTVFVLELYIFVSKVLNSVLM
jgi:poly(A)-specific ribonuclease